MKHLSRNLVRLFEIALYRCFYNQNMWGVQQRTQDAFVRLASKRATSTWPRFSLRVLPFSSVTLEYIHNIRHPAMPTHLILSLCCESLTRNPGGSTMMNRPRGGYQHTPDPAQAIAWPSSSSAKCTEAWSPGRAWNGYGAGYLARQRVDYARVLIRLQVRKR